MIYQGTLETGDTLGVLDLPAKQSAHLTLPANGYLGSVVLEQEGKGGQSWAPINSYSADLNATIKNDSSEDIKLRLRCASFTPRQELEFSAEPASGDLKLLYGAAPVQITGVQGAAELQAALRAVTGLEAVLVTGTFAAGFVVTFVGVAEPEVLANNTSTIVDSGATPVTFTVTELTIEAVLEDVAGDIVQDIFSDNRGKQIIALIESGAVKFTGEINATAATITGAVSATSITVAGVNDINSAQSVVTSGSNTAVSLTKYKTSVVSGGTQGNENLLLGNGAGAIIGQRKLIVLTTRTHASDAVVLDHANFSQGADTITGVVLNAANEFILVEWRGAKWEVIKASTGVVAV